MARSRSERSKLYKLLDQFAAEIAAKDNGRKYNAAFGGDVHEKYVQWRKQNPDEADEYEHTYKDVQSWDASKKPRVEKAAGQGVLGFYDPNGHLTVDDAGNRVRFADATRDDWDDWWKTQVAEHKAQVVAHKTKRGIYHQVRSCFDGPADTIHRVMVKYFHWQEDA